MFVSEGTDHKVTRGGQQKHIIKPTGLEGSFCHASASSATSAVTPILGLVQLMLLNWFDSNFSTRSSEPRKQIQIQEACHVCQSLPRRPFGASWLRRAEFLGIVPASLISKNESRTNIQIGYTESILISYSMLFLISAQILHKFKIVYSIRFYVITFISGKMHQISGARFNLNKKCFNCCFCFLWRWKLLLLSVSSFHPHQWSHH